MGLFSFLESKIDNINGIEFPKFKGGKKVSSWQRNNQKYKRKDYLYKDYDEMQIQSFISEIGTYGFHKKFKDGLIIHLFYMECYMKHFFFCKYSLHLFFNNNICI